MISVNSIRTIGESVRPVDWRNAFSVECLPRRSEQDENQQRRLQPVPRRRRLPQIRRRSIRSVCAERRRRILNSLLSQIGVSNERFLSNAQQTLLTNLVRSFDEHCGLTLISEFQQQQISLPMKLRYRHLPVRRFFTTLFSRVQRVVEKTRDFHSLSTQDRSTLLHTTTRYTSTFAGIFLLHSSELFDNPSFFQSVEMIFRSTTAASIRLLLAQLDSDPTLIKLLLASLAFSSTNSPVFLNRTPAILIHSKMMWAIEEMYIELTWRYLRANCENEVETMKRFSRLTRCLLLLNQVVVQAQDEPQFEEIVERVVGAIEDEWKFPHWSNCISLFSLK